MRNYFFVDQYITELEKDIYPQPQRGDKHLEWATNVINLWVSDLGISNVLDVGCGEGFCQSLFEAYGIEYLGVTLGSEDWVYANSKARRVHLEDFNFLSANGDTYDLVFARHVLEHSFSPLISLMEWHRVAKKYLILVTPTPEHWGETGRNHYHVASLEQIKFWCDRAGWEVALEQPNEEEIWILAKKVKRNIPFYERT